MTEIRSPKSATHVAYGGYNNELFFSRRGRLVYEFSMSRHQWFLTKLKPSRLEKVKRLNIFEMHPTTALQHIQAQNELRSRVH
jgi:hypothetical protein